MLTVLMGCLAHVPVCTAFALQPIDLDGLSAVPSRHLCRRCCRSRVHVDGLDGVAIAMSSGRDAGHDGGGHAAVVSSSWIKAKAKTKALSNKLLAAVSRKRSAAQQFAPGTRGARRPTMRELYSRMTAEEQAQHRYECAKIRLAIEAEAYGYSTRPDLDATDSNLELTTRMAVARRLIRQHEAEILWYEANQNNEKRAAAEAWLAQQLLQDAGTTSSPSSADSKAPPKSGEPAQPARIKWKIEFLKWQIEFRVGVEPVELERSGRR